MYSSIPSFKDQYELDNLPKEIDKLEVQLEALNVQMNQADFYTKDAHTVKQTTNKHKKITQELKSKYARWDELEAK